MRTLSPTTLPLSLVRRMLMDALPSDADLEAFCLDNFPRVQQRFSRGMDRQTKINLLLEQIPSEQIYSILAREAPAATLRVVAGSGCFETLSNPPGLTAEVLRRSNRLAIPGGWLAIVLSAAAVMCLCLALAQRLWPSTSTAMVTKGVIGAPPLSAGPACPIPPEPIRPAPTIPRQYGPKQTYRTPRHTIQTANKASSYVPPPIED